MKSLQRIGSGQTVASINRDVAAGGVGRGVGAEVEVGALQFLGLSLTTHGYLGLPYACPGFSRYEKDGRESSYSVFLVGRSPKAR